MAKRECSAAYWQRLEGERKAKRAAPIQRCSKCRADKPRADFGLNGKRASGLRAQCKTCHNAGNAAWRKKNPERQLELVKRWSLANPDRVKAKMNRWNRKNAQTKRGKLISRISNRMRQTLKGKKSVSTMAALDFTVEQLRDHLERQFVNGMNWDAFMRGEIHIDHIRPVVSFEFETTECQGFKQAWALSNLRPLWELDNKRKKDKRLFLI